MTARTFPGAKLAVEALAIFAAVLAGFWAENYRELLNNRAQAREALAQIVEDLAIDRDDMLPIVTSSESIVVQMLWLHNNLQSADVSADSVAMALSSVANVFSYEAANSAYTGLKTSGDLDLIEDPELRTDLFFYFEDRQAAIEQYNEWVLEGEDRFWDQVGHHVTFAPSESLAVRPDVLTADVNGLHNDRAFRAELVRNGLINENQLRALRQMLELNSELADAVNAALDLD